MAADVSPLSIKREGAGLKIEWSDGVTTVAAFQVLRAKCPCATCNEERGKPVDPFRILTPQEVAAGAPAPVAMTPVGRYAYQIKWNDGHDTGIYPLALLRELGERPA
ncbi:MAG TPA: DUF971 domain-containing protein [Gemmata sp.]